LLNFVVLNERPEEEKRRDETVTSLAENNKKIQILEKNILK